MLEQDTQQIKLKVPHEQIIFLDMVFKSYEGLASLTVSPDEDDIIYLDITEGSKEDVLNILADFKKQFPLEIIK